MPSSFRDLIDIQQDSSDDGESLAEFDGTPLYRNVPCDITTVSGSETFRGRQIEAGLSHVVELQYMENILPTMRANVIGGTLSGRVLNITHVVPLDFNGRARKLQLFCREQVSV